MIKTYWILADATDQRPRDHIWGIYKSEQFLIHAANEIYYECQDDGDLSDEDRIKSLDDLYKYDFAYYFYTEGETP